MRGKKSYNIRNIEAHLNTLQNTYNQQTTSKYSNNFSSYIIQPTAQQRQNEYINAQYGVSKYTSNLVSGKMFIK
jgi:hypothetical protein